MRLTRRLGVVIYLNVFKTLPPPHHVLAERVGRVVFGLVLIVGAPLVAVHARSIANGGDGIVPFRSATELVPLPACHTPELVGAVWLVAALARLLAAVYTALLHTPRDPHALR